MKQAEIQHPDNHPVINMLIKMTLRYMIDGKVTVQRIEGQTVFTKVKNETDENSRTSLFQE